jgi:hypothetical protein
VDFTFQSFLADECLRSVARTGKTSWCSRYTAAAAAPANPAAVGAEPAGQSQASGPFGHLCERLFDGLSAPPATQYCGLSPPSPPSATATA